MTQQMTPRSSLAFVVVTALQAATLLSPVALAAQPMLSPEEEHLEERKIEAPAASASTLDAPKETKTDAAAKAGPEFYGSLELRHRTQREMLQDHGPGRVTMGPRLISDDATATDKPAILLRPTLGANFFDKALDTSFTLQLQNNIGDNRILKTDAINSTQWNVLRGKFNADSPWNFGPSAFTSFFTGSPKGANFSYTDIGLFGEANFQTSVPTGALSLRGYVNPLAEFYSKEYSQTNRQKASLVEGDIGARSSGDLALVGLSKDSNGDITVQQAHPMLLAYYGVGATYLPGFAKNLSLMAGIDLIQTWRPTYYITETADGIKTDLDHYSNQACTFNRLMITYKINDRVSIVDQARHYVGGFYQYGIDTNHPEQTQVIGKVSWENRLSLMVTLF